jgi:hypothetical protein
MTKDELFLLLIRFVGAGQYDVLSRQLIYFKIRDAGLKRNRDIFPIGFGIGSSGYGGLLYAFALGVDMISPDLYVDDLDSRLLSLSDELLRHLKASLLS